MGGAVTAKAASRPRRKSVIALVHPATGEPAVGALVESLNRYGFDVRYLGREDCPRRLAAAVAQERADALELCTPQTVPIELVRALLRELAEAGRPDARIILHRMT